MYIAYVLTLWRVFEVSSYAAIREDPGKKRSSTPLCVS
jgi:hypothetical protein